jgi:hypothetical protein
MSEAEEQLEQALAKLDDLERIAFDEACDLWESDGAIDLAKLMKAVGANPRFPTGSVMVPLSVLIAAKEAVESTMRLN